MAVTWQLASTETAHVRAVTARGWLLATMDSLLMCDYPRQGLLQPLGVRALAISNAQLQPD